MGNCSLCLEFLWIKDTRTYVSVCELHFLLRRSQISCQAPWCGEEVLLGNVKQRTSICPICIDKSIQYATQKAVFSLRQRAAVCC